MIQDKNIVFFNRYTSTKEIEKVYGDAMIRFLYKNPIGKTFESVLASRSISKIYGHLQNMPWTSQKVPSFIKQYGIDLNEFEPGSKKADLIENSYKNFNEFFVRQFKPGKREFVQDKNHMPAFSEARYYGHEQVTDDTTIPVKGINLRARDILGSDKHFSKFDKGPLLIARLCPVDYHRYHYPDNGKTMESYPVHGKFHSVNPMAVESKTNIFVKNERRVSILETENFGLLAYVEVGAVCVGKIVQSHNESQAFNRGDEKGYFLFGGSTVILLGEPGKWRPSDDILKNTSEGVETYIRLGDRLATSNS